MTAISVLLANMDGITLTPVKTQELFNALSVSKARQVCVKTLNDIGRDAERAAKDHVKRTYNLKGSLSKHGFKRRRANNYRLSVRLEGEFTRTPLLDIRGTKQIKTGLRTAIRRASTKQIKTGFIAKGAAYMRTTDRAYPIKRISTVSPGKMFSTKESEPIYSAVIKHKTEEYFRKHLMATIPGLVK